jgi:hypothetical protein
MNLAIDSYNNIYRMGHNRSFRSFVENEFSNRFLQQLKNGDSTDKMNLAIDSYNNFITRDAFKK